MNSLPSPSVPVAHTHYIPARNGAWDVTVHPFGGDFIRPSQDLPVWNVRASHKEGWQLADCEYPNRKGIRTICSDRLKPTCESCGAIGAWMPLGQFDTLCPACGGKESV